MNPTPTMDPIALSDRPILILDGPINRQETQILAAGFGFHDGEIFTIKQEGAADFVLPDSALDLVAMPLTGHWKQQHPAYEWYVVLPKPLRNSPPRPTAPPTC